MYPLCFLRTKLSPQNQGPYDITFLLACAHPSAGEASPVTRQNGWSRHGSSRVRSVLKVLCQIHVYSNHVFMWPASVPHFMFFTIQTIEIVIALVLVILITITITIIVRLIIY